MVHLRPSIFHINLGPMKFTNQNNSKKGCHHVVTLKIITMLEWSQPSISMTLLQWFMWWAVLEWCNWPRGHMTIMFKIMTTWFQPMTTWHVDPNLPFGRSKLISKVSNIDIKTAGQLLQVAICNIIDPHQNT